MKIAGVLFFVASAAFAQSSPDNAAADSLKKRLQSVDLLNPPKPRLIMRMRSGGAVKTGVCAVPLLNATPSGAADSKMAVKPPANAGTIGDELVNVPAPACEK
jgi:hypothetical protein